ncbi:hypothetical protein EDB85DRAFT_2152899 [Lactarius pseudohatsudake]|nr:hypothetical protein EDB85DRAFT_2152899 [Lactarius pseudohatsudake]
MTTHSSPCRFQNEPSRPSSLLAELFDIDLPGVFQLQGLASPCLTARRPGSIDLGVGYYPPVICYSSAFDDALRSLDEDPATFMANPTADELSDRCAAGVQLLTSTCRTFVVPYRHPHGGVHAAGHAQCGDPVLGEPREPEPNAMFYAMTPSPVSTVEPPPTPPAQHQPYVAPVAGRTRLGAGSELRLSAQTSNLATEFPPPASHRYCLLMIPSALQPSSLSYHVYVYRRINSVFSANANLLSPASPRSHILCLGPFSYVLSVPSPTRIYWFIFLPRSGLSLVLAGGATSIGPSFLTARSHGTLALHLYIHSIP